MTGLQPSEAEFQAAVVDLATLRGWLLFHDFDSRRNTAGWPDLFMIHPRTGELLVAELKTHKGRVSKRQQVWIDAFSAAGIVVHVWRPEHMRSGQIPRALIPSDLGRTA